MRNFKFFIILQCLLMIAGGIAYSTDVIVIGNESLPWNGIVEGKNVGIMVDILNEATKNGAPNFQFKLGLPWARAQEMVNEKSDLPMAIIPLTRTAARENKFKWIAELVPNEIRLVTFGRPKPIKTIEEAKNLSVGVILGLSAIPQMKELGFTKFNEVSSIDINLKNLFNKRIDSIVDAKMVYLYNWKKMGYKTSDLQEGPMIGEASHIYIAGGLDFPDDIALSISAAIDKMQKNGKLKAILDKWK
jgi:polar amino acid transport system substrate-binding protein